jgi:hypothetical protein
VKSLKSTLVVLLAIVLWPLTIVAFYEFLRKKRRARRKQQKLSALLDGQAVEDVLLAAPYGYGHFQGEDGYRVWDKRMENGFIGFVRSRLDAELLIVERYLSEAH